MIIKLSEKLFGTSMEIGSSCAKFLETLGEHAVVVERALGSEFLKDIKDF